MKKILFVITILSLFNLLACFMMGMISADYAINGGDMVAKTIAGHVNNTFSAWVMCLGAVGGFASLMFYLFLSMEYNTISKTQNEIDKLRTNYREKDEKLDKLMAHYNSLILQKKA